MFRQFSLILLAGFVAIAISLGIAPSRANPLSTAAQIGAAGQAARIALIPVKKEKVGKRSRKKAGRARAKSKALRGSRKARKARKAKRRQGRKRRDVSRREGRRKARRGHRGRRDSGRRHRRRRDFGYSDFSVFIPYIIYDDYYRGSYYQRRYRTRISCRRAHDLVHRRGYRRVRAYDCRGKVYGFYAKRGKRRYKVRVSAYTGRILAARRY